jgi:adenosylcobalamin-dependent ribonucleoside-triphosphate reductase
LYDRHLQLAELAGMRVARSGEDAKCTEEYWLTCARVVEGTFSILREYCETINVPWNEMKGIRDAQEMYRLMWEFKFLPPGRGLFVMGSPIVEKKGAGALNNCAFVSTKDIDKDFAEPFCFLMDFSALGVGVGGDTRGAGKVTIIRPHFNDEIFVVDDSREGWVALLRVVLGSFVGTTEMPRSIDYSAIRLRGAPLETFGGTASGPDALVSLIDDICILLMNRVGKEITSVDIVDIFNLIGRCVVAGNSRRSAEIMFGDTTDEAFLELKDPTKFKKELDSHRWASNNSVFAEVGQSYEKIGAQTAKNGEPGYFWLENAQKYGRMGHGAPDWVDANAIGGNPCLEQTLHQWELCTLVETFPALHDNQEQYLNTLKYAYLYAKTVTLVSTHYPPTNAVLLKNRRIGCSMSGIVQAIKKFGRRAFFEMCDVGYNYISELDAEYSDWMCVPRSIKRTSVKPSGTVSLLPGQTPGIHNPEAEYYWRVIRFAKDSYIVSRLRGAGYTCIDIDEAKEPNTCAVYFPVKIDDFDRAESDVSMWEQLELAAQMQHHWADNQVSVTVKFDPATEGKDIPRVLEYYETRLKGVSFLPNSELSSYEHLPYQKITKDEYERAIASLLPYDLSESTHEVTESFCDSSACEWKPKI